MFVNIYTLFIFCFTSHLLFSLALPLVFRVISLSFFFPNNHSHLVFFCFLFLHSLPPSKLIHPFTLSPFLPYQISPSPYLPLFLHSSYSLPSRHPHLPFTLSAFFLSGLKSLLSCVFFSFSSSSKLTRPFPCPYLSLFLLSPEITHPVCPSFFLILPLFFLI